MNMTIKAISYSKNNLNRAFWNVQKVNDYSTKYFELVDWIQVYAWVKYNSDWSYSAEIITKNDWITYNDITKILNETNWSYENWSKTKFIADTDSKIKKVIDYLVKMWLKSADSLDFEEEELFWIDWEEDEELTDDEKVVLWIDTWDDVERAFNKEKEESLRRMNVKSNMIRNEVFNSSIWRYEIYISSLQLFPLLDWITLNIAPNLYVPHVYFIEASLKDWQVTYIYKGTVPAKTLWLLYKKAKALRIHEANNEDWPYNIQEYLMKVIKNPYFKFTEWMIKSLNKKQEKCKFCWSESIYSETYSETILSLDVWWWQEPSIVKPFEIENFWEIENVECAACHKDLLTTPKFETNKKDIKEFFSDFSCPICKENAFKSESRKKVKVKLDYSIMLRKYNPKNRLNSWFSVKEIWWLKEVYCTNKWCHWAKYI